MSRWMKGPLKTYARDMLLSDRFTHRNLFRKEAIERILKENDTGRSDRSYHLWALLMLEHWFQAYMDNPT